MKKSPFLGVHYAPKRRRWMAQVRSAKFLQQYHSEMEAAAHYNAVARLQWPDPDSIEKLLERNSPWKGRPSPPVAWRKGKRVIDIDHAHVAFVDEPFYQQFKDEMWFVRRHQGRQHAWVVSQVTPLTERPWFSFTYLPMEALVFGGPCVHLNDKTLDNRLENLAPVGTPVTPAPVILPLSPEKIRSRLRAPDPMRKKFHEELERWQQYEDTGFCIGELPVDPMKDIRFKQYWDEDV